jgi:hypothetical protein
MQVIPVDNPNAPTCEMPARFQRDIAYFMTPGGERGAPKLPAGEYWIDPQDARRWLDEGVLSLVSPLDSEHQAEVELTEDQERFLEWLIEHQIRHVRLSI